MTRTLTIRMQPAEHVVIIEDFDALEALLEEARLPILIPDDESGTQLVVVSAEWSEE